MPLPRGILGAPIDEILKARAILEKPSNAQWSASSRGGLDELAKTLIGKVHEQATELSDKRQYRQAEAAVARGQRLSPNDGKLSELLAKIKALKTIPRQRTFPAHGPVRWASTSFK